MLRRKIFAISLIVLLNVLVSSLVTTFLNSQNVNSATLAPVQTPGGTVSANDEHTVRSNDFEDIPGMVVNTTPLPGGDLVIMFSAENFLTITSTATSVITRCLVDGVQVEPGEVTLRNFLVGLSQNEVRNSTLMFLARNVGPGVHQVRIQGRRAGLSGGITLRERALAVLNVR
jgi:hypothetical protein